MSESIRVKIDQIHASLTRLEAQRSLLGDNTVDMASAALKQQLAALEEQQAAQAAPSEEQRMVTVLFMDIVGSTSLAEQLFPRECAWAQENHGAVGTV